jgi:hypothetical protein
MKRFFGLLLLTWTTVAPCQEQQTQQIWTGKLSDSMCGASHQTMAAAANMSDRECIFECIKALAKYVLVDEQQQVIPIATQDAAGLPLYAGRAVKVTGEWKNGAIVVTKVEPIPITK